MTHTEHTCLVLTIQTHICVYIEYNYSKNNIKLMLWENGNIKINLSGKSENASVNRRIYRWRTRHVLCGTETFCTHFVKQMTVDCLSRNWKLFKGQEFSHLATHSITLHFINKAPGHNGHIFTMLWLEDRLEIQTTEVKSWSPFL